MTPPPAEDALRTSLRCLPFAALIGVLSGAASAAFLWLLEHATRYRAEHEYLVYALPIAGLVLGFIYERTGPESRGGTSVVLEAVADERAAVPLRMGPLVLLGTVLTHLFGGSAGREGTAVQMGGAIAQGIVTRFGKADLRRALLTCGMAGGFGSVFMAQQEQPVQRKVALKIIKLGMDTRQVVARFEQERQALAMMDHPGIAKVLDAGATDTGRPYFVMELVKGDPIVEYCDKNNLSIHDRLELFAQVCSAVQHAHTKGIIHRDIKPSNILVSTQDGRPAAKVIDFGIAKATSSRLTEKTLFTEHRQLIGTPEYMSPEQAEGSLDIDTRTDVYSLGVLLYELLTGTTPFSGSDLRSAAFAELQRIIREVEPPKPSTRLSQNTNTLANVAAQRREEPRSLGKLVRGDLDWIVMKTLEKDRQRRYETANALAMDIRRYLAGDPVNAAPPGALYRARKFVRRNRAAIATAGLVTAALILGVVGTTAGMLRAQRERAAAVVARESEREQRTLAESRLSQAEATVKFLDDMLGAADPSAQGKDITVRSVLDKAAAPIDTQFKSQPLVAARLHATLGRTYLALGEYNPTETHLRAALALNERELGREHPDTCRARNQLGMALAKGGNYPEADSILTHALEDNTRLFGRDNDVTAESMDYLAQLRSLQSRMEDAVALGKELIQVRTKSLGPSNLATISAINTVAISMVDLNQFEESEQLMQKAMTDWQKENGPDHPLSLELRSNCAWLYYWWGMALEPDSPARAEKLAKARTMGEAVVRDRIRVLGDEHPETMTSTSNLASVYRALKMHDEADKLALHDVEVSVRTLGEEHPDTITSIANMGNSLRNRGKYAEAMVYLDRALRNARKSLPKDAQGTAFILGWYGSCLRDTGRYAEAEPMLTECREIATRLYGEEDPITAQMALGLQMLYEAWDKAEPNKGYADKAAIWKAKAPKK